MVVCRICLVWSSTFYFHTSNLGSDTSENIRSRRHTSKKSIIEHISDNQLKLLQWDKCFLLASPKAPHTTALTFEWISKWDAVILKLIWEYLDRITSGQESALWLAHFCKVGKKLSTISGEMWNYFKMNSSGASTDKLTNVDFPFSIWFFDLQCTSKIDTCHSKGFGFILIAEDLVQSIYSNFYITISIISGYVLYYLKMLNLCRLYNCAFHMQIQLCVCVMVVIYVVRCSTGLS